MNEKNEKTLSDYISEKGITLVQFSLVTGISMNHLYKFMNDRDYNITVDTARKIYRGTEEHIGEGLSIHEYINVK